MVVAMGGTGLDSAPEGEQRGAPIPKLQGSKVAAWASHIRSRLLFLVIDAVGISVAYGVAEVTYFRDAPPSHYWRHFAAFLVVALVVQLVANHLFGLYGRIWRHAGIEEARQVVMAAAAALAILLVVRLLPGRLERVPLQVVLIGCTFTTMAMGALRFHSRLFAWQRGARRVGLRVGVIGSRDAGAAAVREMLRSPGAGLVPVAVFDDDGRGHGLSLLGVPVVGGIEDIPAAAGRYMIQQVLLAIPNPSSELVERALQASKEAGVTVKILPSVRDLVAGSKHSGIARRAREPNIEDLLGRRSVSTDLRAVEQSLAGRRVLITGAGGSIGSEIARQVAEFKPSHLVLLDHDETHLHDMAGDISFPCEQVLADVSDRASIFETFLHHRPEIVFHAAAHKHVPMLENHPVEAAKVNIFGTLNVVQASAAVGTSRFVLISSDKAVRPVGVMGASKRVSEHIVLAHCPDGGAYSVVRFGNVLGSRGSVIPTFTRQIAAGGPITVTDPRMTRFFMSVQEAVQLVLQASVLSNGGEIFMLEMGDPIRILDLAERMVRLSGYEAGDADIPISIVGLRPGEKLHEELNAPDEEVLGTAHPAIRLLLPAGPPPVEVCAGMPSLQQATARRDAALVRELIFDLANSPESAEGTMDTMSSAGAGSDHIPA